MSVKTAKDLIRSRVSALLADFSALSLDQTTAVVIYDNDPTDTPAVGPSDDAWVRWWIQTAASRQAELGNPDLNSHRYTGLATAQIHVPVGRGTHKADQLADIIIEHFRSITVSEVVFHTPRPTPGERVEAWWVKLVHCPFHTDFFPEQLGGIAGDTPLSEPEQMLNGLPLVEDNWT